MATNSRQKGKKGEREAANYLRSLGFGGVRRGQQHRGGPDSPDIVDDSALLARLHFEVKYGYPLKCMDIDNAGIAKAVAQACDEAGLNQIPVVLWKPKFHGAWRLTYCVEAGYATVAGDEAIKAMLIELSN